MENLYSGRTNLSTNLKPLQVSTDAKAKLEEIDDKFNKVTRQISDDEQRRAKRIGNWNAVKATNYQTAMTNLRLWDKAFDGLGKGMEAYFEQDARNKQQEVIEGGHTFEDNPVEMSKLLEHSEILKALQNGQIKSQETAEKLNDLGLTEAAERYVSLSDYNKRGVDFAYMQNKASTADRTWMGWLQENQQREWTTTGPDGQPKTFTAENFNLLLPSQQQQVLTSYGHDITKGVGTKYDAATREKYLFQPLRKWRANFLDKTASKSTVLRAREHIAQKTQLIQTHITEALESKDYSVAQDALIKWRQATKFQWNALIQEGSVQSNKSVGQILAEQQEELFENIIDAAALKGKHMVVFNKIIKPVVLTKQYEQIPVTDKNGNLILNAEGKVQYKNGKQILPFGESLDKNERFGVAKLYRYALQEGNKIWDDKQKATVSLAKQIANNQVTEWQEKGMPDPGEMLRVQNEIFTHHPDIVNNDEARKIIENKIGKFKMPFLNAAMTTKRLDELHITKGKVWTNGDLIGMSQQSEQVQNFMETNGISINEDGVEWGTGADKNIIKSSEERIQKTLGKDKNYGWDIKQSKAVAQMAWLEVKIEIQQKQKDLENTTGRRVADSYFANEVVEAKIAEIAAGAKDPNSKWHKTPDGYPNFNQDNFLSAKLISPKYSNQIATYRKFKAQVGIEGLQNTYFTKDHPELLEKTTTYKITNQKEGIGIPITTYHPALATMARDMGVLPSTLWASQIQFRDDAEQALAAKAQEEIYIENKFQTDDLLDLNNMQRLGIDNNFFNRKLNQNLDFPWGAKPLEGVLGDYPPGFGVDKDQAFNEALQQPNRGLAYRTYLRRTRPGIDIATENRIINHLHSMGVFNV